MKLLLYNNTYILQYSFDSSIKCIKINNYYYSKYSFETRVVLIMLLLILSKAIATPCYFYCLYFVLKETSIRSESSLEVL